MTAPTAHHFPEPAAPLVGREREQATLRGALTAALAGRGGLVLIGGEAGIGKTALAEWLLAEASGQGALVLVGRCYDLAETPPYGPWREALARTSHADGLPILPSALLSPDQAGEALPNQEAIFARVLAYLAALAVRRPVALLLDDLHWADPASLDLLRVLARGLAEFPLLILGTYRADELTRRHPLYTLLPLLEREAHATRLNLHRFDEAGVRALVAARYALPPADSTRLVAWLVGRAEGNAFFTAQLLRALEDGTVLRPADPAWTLGDLGQVGLPAALQQVLDARLARLGEEAQPLLALAAVIGQEVPLALWATVAETDEDGLVATVEAAVRAHLLTESPDGSAVRFAHALIREALYAGTLALRRRRIHRRVGEALAVEPSPDPDAVAYHFQRAGDDRAGPWLTRAGERAHAAYAWLTAAERFEAALALLEAGDGDAGRRGWLTFRLASLLRFADVRRALAYADEARRQAEAAGDPLLKNLATYVAGNLRCFTDIHDAHRGLALMEAGLTALAALPAEARVLPGATGPLDPAPRWGTVILQLAYYGRYAEAVARGERYLAEVTPPAAADWLGGNPYADAHSGLGYAYAGLGQPRLARAALARARALFEDVGHHLLASSAAWDELWVAERYDTERPGDLLRLHDLIEVGRARAAGLFDRPVRGWAAPGLLREGRWAELRALGRALVDPQGAFYCAPVLGQLDRAQGLPDAAWAWVRQTLPDGPATAPGDLPEPPFILPQQQLAATLALDAGDLAGARDWLDAHDRWLAWSSAVLGQSEGALGWAAYQRAAGNLAATRAHAERALTHAAEPRQPLALLAAHRYLGELDTEGARFADAAAHLDAALALADACAAPYERALTLLALADLRRAKRQRDAALALLDEARAILAPLEARPALARADALATRLATPAAAPAPAYPAGLSVREAEVLRLVAGGLTNAQVAERLFLSPRTVDQHLRSIYGKLGVENRAAASAFAAEHGLR